MMTLRPTILLCAAIALLISACDDPPAPSSASGVAKATVKVMTDTQGHSAEQRNVMERLKRDNEPGSIKHLYVISSMTGDVLIYSTVNGKVTSGSKRLTPSSVIGPNSQTNHYDGFAVDIGDTRQTTTEVLGDDGAYGSSGDYLYWFDQRGIYHQQYASGCIIHISDQPLPVKHVVLNMELAAGEQADAEPVPPSPPAALKKK